MNVTELLKEAIEKALLGYHGELELDRRWLLMLVEAPAHGHQSRVEQHLLVQIAYRKPDRPIASERTGIVLHLVAAGLGLSFPYESIEVAPGELVLIDLEIGRSVWIQPNAVLYRTTSATEHGIAYGTRVLR